MRVCDYHKQDNKSVLDLPTPLELFKKEHTTEEYDELVSFYSSDEWKEVEREHLNSDRRYYEKRKALIDPEEKEVATEKKYYEPEPFQLRAEEKLTNGFDDLFDDPVLQSCYRELTERQQEVIRMFFCNGLDTSEIAEELGTGVRNIQKIKKCALKKLKTLYVKTTVLAGQYGYSKMVPHNYQMIYPVLRRSRFAIKNGRVKLVAGATYTLHEVSAPTGFAVAPDQTFTVSTNGSVDSESMIDLTTKVQISKQDITNGKELPGAKLQVIDSNGDVVEEWTSTNTPHYIEGKLIAGETYTLVEKSSPDGYLIAEAVTFSVSLDGSVDKVVMKDARIKGFFSLTKVDKDYPQNKLTGAVFEVYKDVDKDGKYNADVDVLIGTMTETEIGIYEMDLEYGYYLVYEKKAPANFKHDTNYYPVFVEKDGEKYVIENEAGVGFVNEEKRAMYRYRRKLRVCLTLKVSSLSLQESLSTATK